MTACVVAVGWVVYLLAAGGAVVVQRPLAALSDVVTAISPLAGGLGTRGHARSIGRATTR